MGNAEAAVTLQEVEGLRRQTRTRSYASWLAFLVFGALTLGAIPFALAGNDGVDGFYWLIAGPLGLGLTWHLFQRRGERIGVIDRNSYALAAIITAMVGGAIAIGWAGGESAFSEAGTLYPIAAGLLAIGTLRRSGLVATAGIAIAVWGSAVLVVEPDEIAAWAYAGEGLVLVAAGLTALVAFRRAERR